MCIRDRCKDPPPCTGRAVIATCWRRAARGATLRIGMHGQHATSDPRQPARVAVPGVDGAVREPPRRCRSAAQPPERTSTTTEASSSLGASGHRRLACAACRTSLAEDARATERAGAHRHLCANPAGVVYAIRLFVGSWSIAAVGTSSAAHSWFPGATWQIAVCRRCHLHLGWLFHEAAPFAGLIEGAYVEESAPGSGPGSAA